MALLNDSRTTYRGLLSHRGNRQAALPFSGRSSHSRFASHQAAVSALEQAKTWEARLYVYIAASGARGVTDWEAHVALGLARHLVPARRAALVEAELVVSCGVRRDGPSQRPHAVWRLK